jgi:hypothetical protein
MITPEDREAGLPMSTLLQLQALGGDPPDELGKGSKASSLTGRVLRLGWKIVQIPVLCSAREYGGSRDGAFITFRLVSEWLIVPPDDSPIRARKVRGKTSAIRAAYRLAIYGEDDLPQPEGHV